MAAPPAATVRKRRRAWSTDGILGVFVGGVLSTRSAWALGGHPCWFGLGPRGRLNPSSRLAFLVTLNMGKSIQVTAKKRRGRPATTGKGIQVGERWHAAELTAIDEWIASQGEGLTRAQAIRRLVEIGLKVTAPAKPGNKPGRRQRAQELAANAIEKMIDAAAPAGERAQRKHRLTKGPSEFRENRVDQPKAKK